MFEIVLTAICLVSTCGWKSDYVQIVQPNLESCEKVAAERNRSVDANVKFVCAKVLRH
jgi:hypothetical protein